MKTKKEYKVQKTESEWKEELSNEDYKITRQKGTEPAFNNEYWDHKKDGTYLCKCCEQILFESNTKYDSGSGWPSFYALSNDGNVDLEKDTNFGMTRTEVLCNNCGAHLGHLFNDGPQPTGMRYCMNSASLKFDDSKE